MMQPSDMMTGWTTTGTREDAAKLARGMIEAGLAACAQISGPITSYYRWESRLEQAEEYRLTVKYPTSRDVALTKWLGSHHPYSTPQWVAIRADAVAEKYLKWVLDNPS